MYFRSILALSFSISLAILIGCGSDPLPEVDAPDSLILYSIDGRDKPDKNLGDKEDFRGYPVLGKVEITDFKKRKAIIAALEKGMADSDGTMAKCFWPRHAIRLTENGKMIDFVICFECSQVKIFMEGLPETKATTSDPQSELNKHLIDANIPLTPGMIKAGD